MVAYDTASISHLALRVEAGEGQRRGQSVVQVTVARERSEQVAAAVAVDQDHSQPVAAAQIGPRALRSFPGYLKWRSMRLEFETLSK
jgi:hypothetical protein